MKKYIGLIALAIVLSAVAQAQVSTFSSGESTPESITKAPEHFGKWDDFYFVPDYLQQVIWAVPKHGGTPQLFVSEPGYSDRGGFFLPKAWGALAGQYLAAGNQNDVHGVFIGDSIHTFDKHGTMTSLLSGVTDPLGEPLLVTREGPLENDVLIGGETSGNLYLLKTDGTFSTLMTGLDDPFGLTFAPREFGAFDRDLFYTSTVDGTVGAIDDDGNKMVFHTITAAEGLQTNGLRQCRFAPRNWLAPIGVFGRVLLVSIADSPGNTGTGAHGSIAALDKNGKVVATLTRSGLKFDPRGMHFLNEDDDRHGDDEGGDLLVSDATGAILRVCPTAFAKSSN